MVQQNLSRLHGGVDDGNEIELSSLPGQRRAVECVVFDSVLGCKESHHENPGTLDQLF